MPDEAVQLDEFDPRFGAGGVEQAQLHPFGDFTEQCEVRARPVVRRTQRIGGARTKQHVPPSVVGRMEMKAYVERVSGPEGNKT